MGLFGFGKKKHAEKVLKELKDANDLGQIATALTKNGVISKPKGKNHNTFGQRLDVLTPDGDLPFGWVSYYEDFVKEQTDRINKAYEPIYSARKTSDKLSYFKKYFEVVNSVGEYCKEKGETYYKWFSYYIIESTWYGEQVSSYRQLTADAPKLIEHEKWFEQLETKIEKLLPVCDGKLQSEFVKAFEHNEQDYVRFYLSRAEKDGRIQRTKSGRSYILKLK